MSPTTRTRLTNRVHRQAFLNHSDKYKQERARAMNARRDPVIAALYASHEWKVLRASVLADACGRCATMNCARVPRVVDHMRPHRGDNGLFFDRDNLQALCKVCHDRKTARFDGAFGRAPRVRIPRTISAPDASPFPVGRGPGQRGGQ